MPRHLAHALIWEEGRQCYQLRSSGQLELCYFAGDEVAFSAWLEVHTAFAFVGKAGRVSVLKEARRGGREYWYACRTQQRHTSKRYLGSSAKVTFGRLEEVARELNRQLAPLPSQQRRAAESREAFLAARLSPPRLPPALVERPRLQRMLDAALVHPLTLISAPAGSGKTTLLSAWIASFARQEPGANAAGKKLAVAWLSLEELDNEPLRFWVACIAALRRVLPALGETALALLHAQETLPLSTCLISLLQEIEQVDRELLLILDDYQVISEPGLIQSMHFLLEHLPANLHLVLASRADPELPLARLRVRQQLLEIRDPGLRFTWEETATFLRQGMGLPLSEDEVIALQARTEGWIAGLQLAAISRGRQEDFSLSLQSFTGSHRLVLDYVQQEILASLPVKLKNFVLQTALLARMDAALCQAVTALPATSTCQELLEALERAHLFVIPLDEHRRWYRYHDLFREALQAQLQRSQPEMVPLLHMRAARWYAGAGEWREAIAHALLAPDYSYAATLMEQAAPHFWHSGEGRIVLTWVLALPGSALSMHTRLALAAALHVLYSVPVHGKGVVAEVERVIKRLQGLVQGAPSLYLQAQEAALVERRLFLLLAFGEARAILGQPEPERLQQLARAAEALPMDAEVSWNLIPLTLTFWLTDFFPQMRVSLIPGLLAAKQQALQAAHYPTTIRIVSLLGETYIKNGQLQQARRQYLEALALIEQSGVRTSLTGSLYLDLFTLSYAQNQLAEAADWLRQALRIAYDWRQPYLQAQGECASMRLALARGDLSAANQALQRLDTLLAHEEFPRYVPREEYALWKVLSHLQYWLASRNLPEAQAWAQQHMLSPWTWEFMASGELLMLVQVLLTQRQYSQACDLLSRFRERLCDAADLQTCMQFLALSLVAFVLAERKEEAWRWAERLFALTEPEGSIRLYLDLGLPMKQALTILYAKIPSIDEGAREAAVRRAYIAQLLALFAQEEQRQALPAGKQPARDAEAQSSALPRLAVAALPEPLTAQELRILRLLALGRTNREIAETLVVSLNTVKSHLKHLYSKLAVNSRMQACARARDLQVL
ncbi:LuxR C-terminal-related transcriptional regulator [Ktedonosporobacter rubrisoli]|uniref:LuxR C-terminal-related transcriptional regulator n=1 Tax=Ktedonosporobacter rubrisoli TaxID=2509675 RepID=UPI0013EE74E1|nr:LuxR C-terminal-related transcriptional regulator [Ktedonosporobacter rubrisoli]